MRLNKDKKYEAQALAMAMVIMVVSSIIAMSVYFRSQKDKTLTLEERASAEALEISDLIIDKLTLFPVQDVIEKVSELQEEPFDYSIGTVPPLSENFDTSEISSLLSSLGVEENIRALSICPIDIENGESFNEYQLTIRQADENTYFEIRPGQVWSLPIKGYDLDANCLMSLNFAVRGDPGAGFSVIKSYAKDYLSSTPSYKDYDYLDIQNYCFADTDSSCNNQDNSFFDSNWEKYNITESNSEVPIELKEVVDGYVLDEVRIKAIGGTVGLKYKTTPPECLTGLRMIHLRVTANCYGVYRGKEVLIPEKKWHNTLFDYAVFNGQNSI